MRSILCLRGIVKVANPLNMEGIKTKREEGVTDYRRNKAIEQDPEWPQRLSHDKTRRQDKKRKSPINDPRLARQSEKVPKCLILSRMGALKEGKFTFRG